MTKEETVNSTSNQPIQPVSRMTKGEYFPTMMDRLAHVENLRHGIMTLQLTLITAVLSQFFTTRGSQVFSSFQNAITAFGIAFAALKLLEVTTFNLFAKSMRAATEMMIIEYSEGLVDEGIGYFSFRRNQRALEYRISGMVPEALMVFFVAGFSLLARKTLKLCWVST